MYTEIENYIENYTASTDEFYWEDFLDGIEEVVEKLYPGDKVQIWSWEVDNDTFRVDSAFDSILEFAKDHTITTHSINWDAEHENILITIVYKG